MKKRQLHRLTICVLACLVQGPVWAEGPARYRVDVIVFSHLAGESDQRHRPEMTEFGSSLDTATNARAAAWSPLDLPEELSSEDQARIDALATIDQLRALENPEQRSDGRFRGGPVFPIPWLELQGLHPSMASAWQRLEASPRHLPLVWRSWYQPLSENDSGRWIRLRGGQFIDLDWLEQEVVDPQYVIDLESGPFPFLLPRTAHQLDGVIRLRRRQFMHVDIDLVWQMAVMAVPSPMNTEWYRPGGFHVHPLEQSRSVRTDRIEYFDSSLLGVLVHIKAWQSPFSAQDASGGSP